MDNTFPTLDDFAVGRQEITVKTITEEDVNTFGHFSGDLNPLHMDNDFASQTAFGRRVVHGMLTAALISRTHTNLTGPGFVYVGQELNFKGPVYIGDTITITLSITAKKEDKGILVCETNVSNQTGKVVLQGKSAVKELVKVQM